MDRMYGYAPPNYNSLQIGGLSSMPRLMSSRCGVSKMCITLQDRVTRFIAENVKTTHSAPTYNT